MKYLVELCKVAFMQGLEVQLNGLADRFNGLDGWDWHFLGSVKVRSTEWGADVFWVLRLQRSSGVNDIAQ